MYLDEFDKAALFMITLLLLLLGFVGFMEVENNRKQIALACTHEDSHIEYVTENCMLLAVEIHNTDYSHKYEYTVYLPTLKITRSFQKSIGEGTIATPADIGKEFLINYNYIACNICNSERGYVVKDLCILKAAELGTPDSN